MSNLSQVLASRAEAISKFCVTRLCEDPFWQERCGPLPVRVFAQEDFRFLLAYLVEALAQNSPTLFPDYARWLQSVVTTRGFATVHLERNFQTLADAVKSEPVAATEPALAQIRSALMAMVYPAGAGRPVMLGRSALMLGTLERMDTTEPSWVEGWPLGRSSAAREITVFISYLADALALRRPEVLQDNVGWYAGFLERFGVSWRAVALALRTLGQALNTLPPEDREVAQECLSKAIGHLDLLATWPEIRQAAC